MNEKKVVRYEHEGKVDGPVQLSRSSKIDLENGFFDAFKQLSIKYYFDFSGSCSFHLKAIYYKVTVFLFVLKKKTVNQQQTL